MTSAERGELEKLVKELETTRSTYGDLNDYQMLARNAYSDAVGKIRALLARFPEPEPGWRPAFLSLSFEPGGGGHYYGKYDRAAVDRLADERDALVARVAELEAQVKELQNFGNTYYETAKTRLVEMAKLVDEKKQLEAQLAAAEERQARAKHWLGELKHLGEIQMKAEASFMPSVFGESWDKGWKNGHEAAGMACQALAGHGLAEVEALDAGREGG